MNHKSRTLSLFFASALISSLLFLSACGSVRLSKDEWSAQDFYEAARGALETGEFKLAIEHLESLEARLPFNHYAKQAQLDIAYSYYKFDEPESALSAADRFLRLHPRDPHIDYIYYLKGLVHFHRGRSLLDKWFPRDPSKHEAATMKKAIQEFAILVKRFPDSRYAGDAFQRMVYLRNMLAKQEINAARHYIELGAWLSAVNRSKTVIEQYKESSYTLTALEIMVEAYKNLGLEDLANDTQRILDLNQKNLAGLES